MTENMEWLRAVCVCVYEGGYVSLCKIWCVYADEELNFVMRKSTKDINSLCFGDFS